MQTEPADVMLTFMKDYCVEAADDFLPSKLPLDVNSDLTILIINFIITEVEFWSFNIAFYCIHC